MIGMGFELLETLIYSIQSDHLGQTLFTGFIRSLLGLGLHAL
jgi:RsiW-degrading membrane proteinase PrsW (M82 family)